MRMISNCSAHTLFIMANNPDKWSMRRRLLLVLVFPEGGENCVDKNSASTNVTVIVIVAIQFSILNRFLLCQSCLHIPLFPFVCWSLSPPSMGFSFSASSPCSEPSREAPAELSLSLALALLLFGLRAVAERIFKTSTIFSQGLERLFEGFFPPVKKASEGIRRCTTVNIYLQHNTFEDGNIEFDTKTE